MSVSIFPCRGCPLREGCEQRGDFTRRASGIGARSVAFKCARLGAEIRPGRRVIIRQPVAVAGRGWDDDGYHIRHVEVPATITSAGKHYAFASTVDAGAIEPHLDPDLAEEFPETIKDQFRFRKLQRHSRVVRFLDEDDRRVCEHGGRVQPAPPGGQCDRPAGEPCHCAEASLIAKEFAR